MELKNKLDPYSCYKSQTCSVNLLPEEINKIKKFASCNGFPKSISTSIIRHALNKSINDNYTDDDNDII